MTQTDRKGSSADGVSWNLDDLYQGLDDPAIAVDTAAALERAKAFEAAYRGKIETPEGPSADLLLAALVEMESLGELLDKPGLYAGLLHAGKTDDPKRGALLASTRERRTLTNQHLIFFDLEWVKVPEDRADALIADPKLAGYSHYLKQVRAWKPHYLTEPEEKILQEKTVTGRSAFVRLFEETTSSLRCPFVLGETTRMLGTQEILSKLYDSEREVRQAAATGLTEGLKTQGRLLTYIFNTVVLDHKSDSALRRFDDPMGSRHLANEIEPVVVEALMAATERYHPTVHRYYKLKARLLKLDQLQDYDRYAPLFSDSPLCDWPTARRIVKESYERFSPEAGTIVGDFFEKHWIDAELREGKRGGAFSSGGIPSVHPYILMNFNDKLRDVMTLAHELGHGIHQYLSRRVGYLQAGTPLTTAEMASVFGEMLTFQRLLDEYQEPRTRLALLCGKIEDAFATVFRQVVLTRFEQALHQARRDEGELATERINELWLDANRAMHGDAVALTDGYACWWMYIGHFIRSPFYCYAYAFGELLVLALFQKYKEDGRAFVPRYLEMLASGGSKAPDVLLKGLGVDVNALDFWELGLKLLDGMVEDAEALAGSL